MQIANEADSVLHGLSAYAVLDMHPVEPYCVPDQELVPSRIDLVTAGIHRAALYATRDVRHILTQNEIDDGALSNTRFSKEDRMKGSSRRAKSFQQLHSVGNAQLAMSIQAFYSRIPSSV